MITSECWENAFGASWLDICSLQSSVAMIPGVTLTGNCKSWTLDSGLDRGLDYGLDWGSVS